MADTVATQILQNGPRNIVVKFTNFSDGTGESLVKKIDATSTGPYGVSVKGQTFYPGIHLSLYEIHYSIDSMALRLQWEASSNADLAILAPNPGNMKFVKYGGLTVPVVAGATGSVLFTTEGAVINASYTVIMHFKKNVAFG